MTTLKHWLIFVGTLIAAVLLAMVILALSGRPDVAVVTGRLAVALSAIGLLFAALMLTIIVWCEVRTGLTLEHSPRSGAVPSAASQPRVTFPKNGVR